MIDPTRHRQMQEMEAVTLAVEILTDARNELYLNMRFLDMALSSLTFEAGESLGTDGFILYYRPERLFSMYRRGRVLVNRAFLHMVLHCLFCHLDGRGSRERGDWDLACDMAVESILDGLYRKCVYVRVSPYRRKIYGALEAELRVPTAEGIYGVLKKWKPDDESRRKMAEEFYVDDHSLWGQNMDPQLRVERQNRWKDNRERMQTELESFGEKEDGGSGRLLEQIQVENRERYDYRRFLRRFAVLKEEAQVDPDSFDYIFYTYGLSLYGNIPLVEPLETREVRRIEDFVIAVDTSMSCSGELVKRFLEETYAVLCESESYFKKIHIHILQCDDKIRSDKMITGKEELESYMRDFAVSGKGGTDFRPVFEYVGQMLRRGTFQKLKGLLYFTDGKGIYPLQAPPYDTAFVFVEERYEDMSVPAWAMKLILTPEALEEKPGGGFGTGVKDDEY